MDSHPGELTLCLCVLYTFIAMVQGDFLEPITPFSLRSLVEGETRLPCRFQVGAGQVVQVTWTKETPDGNKESIITAHPTNGETAFGLWSNRVRFSSSEPMVDSSLIIMTTVLSDEGKYFCKIITFPSGNFEAELSLTVWTIPISSLDPVTVVEGESFRVAASCRSVARPPPTLSWDTELTGQTSNRTFEGGAVSSYFSLHPLRNMNGKKLDCLVTHPALEHPRRISNYLIVHYPPHVDVSGFDETWHVGQEGATLRCRSGGNPKPQSFIWTRKGGALPEGVIPHNETLLFGRPLSLTDAGVYQCAAKNVVGRGDGEVEVTISETAQKPTVFDGMLMIIVGGAAGGLLLLMLILIVVVTCHHKHKNKKLKRELTKKKEEISTLTLSRQPSFRRVNSVSTDARGQTEENIPLRVEGTLRTSLSSLADQGRCRDSRSTLSGGRYGSGVGGGGGVDYLGRPLIYNSSRRGRERALEREEDENLRRVESFVRNSTMSLETRLHPPLHPSPFPMEPSTELHRSLNGSAMIPSEGGLRQGTVSRNQQHSPLSVPYAPVTEGPREEGVEEVLGGQRSPVDEGQGDDRYSETNSSQLSDASNHQPSYRQNNGSLRSMPPTSPHTSMVHKAQVV